MDGTPRTLLEAVTYFSDPDRAHAYAVKLRWPNGIACPRKGCGNADVQFIKTRKLWRCKECKRQFTAKVGTIFEDSPISFTKWLPAIWFLANTKNGTSSHELGRAIGVTQKTAWFMFHRIRLAMKETSAPALSGEVEVDETFVGGKTRATKVNVLGMRKLAHGPAPEPRSGDGGPEPQSVLAHPAHLLERVAGIGTLHRRPALVSADRSGLHPQLHRPLPALRRRPRPHEQHRKLLVVFEADAPRDVYRASRFPSGSLR